MTTYVQLFKPIRLRTNTLTPGHKLALNIQAIEL